ncbi:hypothetical protein [Modicisalibacter xianhensis]|uniref:Uncharacterized protein n=1 Tax=Modicisalibacter xianhensis TaxID=442341 RepID=A0A1I3ACH7_9GAMM|nr:hypothetical protein [Halomonas xianhensis]SFH47797.1 hypothetical protein SAMN04487959_104290 [Halomonas xianhensis]
MSGRRHTARRIALAILALLLFSPPVIGLFDIPSAITGLSWLPLYLFCAWGGIIALTAWLQSRESVLQEMPSLTETRSDDARHEK